MHSNLTLQLVKLCAPCKYAHMKPSILIGPIPSQACVYVIRLDGVIAYIGQSANVRQRILGHGLVASLKFGLWKGALFRAATIAFIAAPCEMKRLRLESLLIRRYRPPLNVSGNPSKSRVKVNLVAEPKNANFRRFVIDMGSQANVAALLNMSPGHVSLIYNGKRRVTVDMAERIEIATRGKYPKESLVFKTMGRKYRAAKAA